MTTLHCRACNRDFDSLQGIEQHNQAKHGAKPQMPFLTAKNKKKIKFVSYAVIVLLVIGGTGYFLRSNIKNLPPTDIQGHVESWPESQINKNPIPIVEFKHILEHTHTPNARPGVVINYNCQNYDCPTDLISSLERFAEEFEHVYVAPYPRMDAMIALTRLKRQKVLEAYDAEAIRSFVR